MPPAVAVHATPRRDRGALHASLIRAYYDGTGQWQGRRKNERSLGHQRPKRSESELQAGSAHGRAADVGRWVGRQDINGLVRLELGYPRMGPSARLNRPSYTSDGVCDRDDTGVVGLGGGAEGASEAVRDSPGSAPLPKVGNGGSISSPCMLHASSASVACTARGAGKAKPMNAPKAQMHARTHARTHGTHKRMARTRAHGTRTARTRHAHARTHARHARTHGTHARHAQAHGTHTRTACTCAHGTARHGTARTWRVRLKLARSAHASNACASSTRPSSRT